MLPQLNFYDLKAKKSFETNKYDFETKIISGRIRYFAVANSPSGTQSYRIISQDFFEENKELTP